MDRLKNLLMNWPVRILLLAAMALGIGVPLMVMARDRRDPGGARKVIVAWATSNARTPAATQATGSSLQVQGVLEPAPAATQVRNCTYPSIYWKDHPESWLTENIIIDRFTYSKTQALEILGSDATDLASRFLKQFLGVALNILNGADSHAIDPALNEATFWLNANLHKVNLSDLEAQQGEGLLQAMENYNNGNASPGACPDAPVVAAPTATSTPTLTPTPTWASSGLVPVTATDFYKGGGPGPVPVPTATPAPGGPPPPTSTPAGGGPVPPTPTNAPTDPPPPTEAPKPTDAPRPTNTPRPTNEPKPTKDPVPTDAPTDIPPTDAPAPTDPPPPTQAPRPTKPPKPTKQPKQASSDPAAQHFVIYLPSLSMREMPGEFLTALLLQLEAPDRTANQQTASPLPFPDLRQILDGF